MTGFLIVVRSEITGKYFAVIDSSVSVWDRGINLGDVETFDKWREDKAFQLTHAIKTARGSIRYASLDYWASHAFTCKLLMIVSL